MPIIDNNIVLIAILRAGLGMINAALKLMPTAKVGHIGLHRNNDNFGTTEYYYKMPLDLNSQHLFLFDPMIATGSTAITAIDKIKHDLANKKAKALSISFVNLISSPIGIYNLKNKHKNVNVYTAAIDESLDQNNYIIPGLGDAGDRIFATTNG